MVLLLRLVEPRSSPPPHTADYNSTELVAPPLAATANRAGTNPAEKIVLLRPFRVVRAEASRRGGPQLAMLVLGPAGFDPLGRQGRT